MQVYIDDKSYTPGEAAAGSIQDLVEELRPELTESRRTIIAIQCDQQPIPDAELDAVLEQPCSAFQRLDLTTVSTLELASEALLEALKLFQETSQVRQTIVEALAEDRTEEAVETLGICIEAWARAHDTVYKTLQLIEVNIDALAAEGIEVSEILNQVAVQLRQIKECLAAHDYVLLNDVLQYELAPIFDQWEKMISGIIKQVQTS